MSYVKERLLERMEAEGNAAQARAERWHDRVGSRTFTATTPERVYVECCACSRPITTQEQDQGCPFCWGPQVQAELDAA
jgi:hypothetical protein